MGRPTTDVEHERTRQGYEDPAIVARYVSPAGLRPCEALLFERYITAGARVLDLGVGGGRTTPALARRSREYIGLDYSAAMVEACRTRFPALEFVQRDAADLSPFESARFDAVVFSFNGIDCLVPEASRRRCLAEMRRVVADDGVVILSSHRPFPLIRRPGPLRGVSVKLAARRLTHSARASLGLTWQLARSPSLWRGSGYSRDPTQGRSLMYAATPAHVASMAEGADLSLVERLDADEPLRCRWWNTTFTYYVFRPSTAAASTPRARGG